MMPITVLLACDIDVERESIRRLLESHAEVALVGEAATFPQATQMSNDLKPQVVLLDLHLPDDAHLSPFEVKSLLNSGASRLLVISIYRDAEANVLADNFGAYTLLDKSKLDNKIIAAILGKPESPRAKAADNR
jgi:DNA-binding NarL/FixJ family response regulator